MSVKYIAMFSGSSCMNMAIGNDGFGWEPICFAEFSPENPELLEHPFIPRIPDMKHHNWRQYRDRVEAVISGCDRPFAGLRDNLDPLFMEATNAIDPEIIFWENETSILTEEKQAFGRFLAAVVGEAAPDFKVKKWTGAGVVVGTKRCAAWHTVTVPNPSGGWRQRILLVAGRVDAWANPVALLLDPATLRPLRKTHTKRRKAS